MRGLTNTQRTVLMYAVARDPLACEVPITTEEARDLVARGLTAPAPDGDGWHDVDIAKAAMVLRVDAAARAAGVWP
jgi:hypothetical protein